MVVCCDTGVESLRGQVQQQVAMGPLAAPGCLCCCSTAFSTMLHVIPMSGGGWRPACRPAPPFELQWPPAASCACQLNLV